MSNYNTYGVHISKTKPIIKKGTKVKYLTNYRDTDGKLIKFYIFGVWDGEKATFNDKDHHVIRTTWWLEKVTVPSPYQRLRQYITTLLNQ